MSFLQKFLKPSLILKVAAAVGYALALVQSIDSIASIPFPLIGLGIFVLEFLPLFGRREFRLLYFWVLYTIFTYSLLTYHENNVCLLDSCVGDEFTSLLSAASTGVLWASIKVSANKQVVSRVAKPQFLSQYKPDETIELRWV